jgi:hypothetical protein
MSILPALATQFQSLFPATDSGQERGRWFLLTLQAILVPITASRTSNLLRAGNQGSVLDFTPQPPALLENSREHGQVLDSRTRANAHEGVPTPQRGNQGSVLDFTPQPPALLENSREHGQVLDSQTRANAHEGVPTPQSMKDTARETAETGRSVDLGVPFGSDPFLAIQVGPIDVLARYHRGALWPAPCAESDLNAKSPLDLQPEAVVAERTSSLQA